MDRINSQPITSSQFIQNAAKQTLEKMDASPREMYHLAHSEKQAMEVFSRAMEENGTTSEKQLMSYVKKASGDAVEESNRYGGSWTLIDFARKGVYVATLQNLSAGITGPLSKAIAQIALDSHKKAEFCGHGDINREFARAIQETGSPIEKEAMAVLNSAYDNQHDLNKSSNKMTNIQLSFMKDVITGIDKPLKEYLLEKTESSNETKEILGKAVTEKLESMASGDEKVILNTTGNALKGNKFGIPNGFTQNLVKQVALDSVKTTQTATLTQNLAKLGSDVVKNASLEKWYPGMWTGSESYGGIHMAHKGDYEAQMEALKAGTAYIESIAANTTDKKEKVLSQAIVDTINIAQNQYEKTAAFSKVSWDILDYSLDVMKNGTKGPMESHLAACGMALMMMAPNAKPKYAVEIAQPILQAIANNSEDPKNAEIAREALNIETSVGKAIKSTLFIGDSNKEHKIKKYTEAFDRILENVDTNQLGNPEMQDSADVKTRANFLNRVASNIKSGY